MKKTRAKLAAACAQRLSASEVNAVKEEKFTWGYSMRAQRLSASEVNAADRYAIGLLSAKSAQRLSASEVNADGYDEVWFVVRRVCSTPFGVRG